MSAAKLGIADDFSRPPPTEPVCSARRAGLLHALGPRVRAGLRFARRALLGRSVADSVRQCGPADQKVELLLGWARPDPHPALAAPVVPALLTPSTAAAVEHLELVLPAAQRRRRHDVTDER